MQPLSALLVLLFKSCFPMRLTSLILACLVVPATLLAATIPAANFAALPKAVSLSLSPDGKHMVALRASGDTYHVVVTNLSTMQSKLLMAADPEKFTYESCRFANNSRVICTTLTYAAIKSDTLATGYYYKDGRTIFTNLLAVDIDGSNVLQLVPQTKVHRSGRDIEWNSPNQSDIINWLPEDKNHILMQIAREDRLHPSVYKLNINDNKMQQVVGFKSYINSWWANNKGKVIAAAGFDGKMLKAYGVNGNKTTEIDIAYLSGTNPPTPLGIAADGKSLWVAANNGANTMGLHRIDLMTGSLIETLYSNTTYDVNNLVLNPRSWQPAFTTYYADTLSYQWFDADLQKAFEDVVQRLPGSPTHVAIVSTDKLQHKIILQAQGNGTLPTKYLFDRQARTLAKLFEDYANVGTIEPVTSVVYAARDGRQIPAYVSLPAAASKGPFATIIFPHGGPFHRDTDAFNYWVQFFHSRGYAVLQPNFRGSSGYGDEFLAAGYQQWGLTTQDDVIDGLDWMIAQGYTDPQRTCIVGASYGGYVANVAAYKTPERFRCAVSFAGVANLDELADRWSLLYMGGSAIERLQKGPQRDANSPIKHIEKITLPMLVVHGDIDRRVMVEQSREFVTALQGAGKQVTYIEQVNGNHHLSLQGHRTEFFEAMDKFLATYLQP
jgi:dipeptidyl aminopeptidase/acylaminoacyl peptidase